MENCQTNRSRFLQQYAGIGIIMTCVAKSFQIDDRTLNGVMLNDNRNEVLYLSKDRYSDFYAIEEWQANLIPLSSITDEYALDLATFVGMANAKVARLDGTILIKDESYAIIIDSNGINMYYNGKTWNDDQIKIVDKIRSLGIAYEWMGLSVEKQIEYGWIKLT